MNKRQAGSKTKIREAIERAMQALKELEAALSAGDNRKIGAKMSEIRRALKEASREAQ